MGESQFQISSTNVGAPPRKTQNDSATQCVIRQYSTEKNKLFCAEKKKAKKSEYKCQRNI